MGSNFGFSETAAAHPRSKQLGIRLREKDLGEINKQPHRFIENKRISGSGFTRHAKWEGNPEPFIAQRIPLMLFKLYLYLIYVILITNPL
jgi:hypothetical protein